MLSQWDRSPEGNGAKWRAWAAQGVPASGTLTAPVHPGTTTNGRSWSGWTAGDSSTNLAKTPAAGRRKSLSGVGTEGPIRPGPKRTDLQSAAPPGRTARPPHSGVCPALLWREAEVPEPCQPSPWDPGLQPSSPPPTWDHKPWALE